MNIEEFINEVELLGIKVSDDNLLKLDIYLNFLKEYNSHTNLTAIKDDNDIYLKHFYDSLTIIKAVDLNNYNNLIDIGSGAGFPGMVLKIFFPNLDVTLIDSNNKKTTFLKQLAEKLNLNVNIINERVENFSKDNLNKYDIVTSRAVANLRVLSEISLPLVRKDGYFVPLKAKLDKNLEDSVETIKILDSKIINKVKFELFNNSGTRNILVIQKNNETEEKILRPYDKIIKKPLKKKLK